MVDSAIILRLNLVIALLTGILVVLLVSVLPLELLFLGGILSLVLLPVFLLMGNRLS